MTPYKTAAEPVTGQPATNWFAGMSPRERKTFWACFTGWALDAMDVQIYAVLMPTLMILMYLTPILYPLALVPASVRPWVAANPFGWLVGRLRDALLDGRLALEPADAVALAGALLAFVGGRWMFRRLSPHFEDFL